MSMRYTGIDFAKVSPMIQFTMPRSTMTQVRLFFALCCFVVPLASCDSGPTPSRWIALADGFEPATRFEPNSTWATAFIGGDALTLSPESHGTGAWVTANLPTDAWNLAPFGHSVWRARRPIWDSGTPTDPDLAPQRLDDADQAFRYIPYDKTTLSKSVAPGDFTGVLEYVYLTTEGERPKDTRYSVFVERGFADGRCWRIGTNRFLCDGFPLWSGHSEEIVTAVPENSVLQFGSTACATAARLGASAGLVTIRILLDGDEVFVYEQSVKDIAEVKHHRVVLPKEARQQATFRFETIGPAAICAVLNPVLAPATIGTFSNRPSEGWPKTPRKNMILFLADTFRADNLGVYGSKYPKSLTPNLDRLAEASVVFTRTWSPASWTLPAQASMMSGLYPMQHGVVRRKNRITDDIVTLAEVFDQAGYRTGAITDSLLVSRHFGFDQGFQCFDELSRPIDQTLAETRAFIDADDGRPFFLFVQTYRTHAPFLATAQTRSEYAEVLKLRGTWASLNAELLAAGKDWDQSQPPSELMQSLIRDLEQLYRGGVVDLDRALGQFLDDYYDRYLSDNTVLVFTSDHGEAFGEHQQLFHGNGVFGEDVRIPLLFHGPSIKPASLNQSASLVDLPRTLAHLAGLQPASRWGGRDLFESTANQLAFSFQCPASGAPGQAAIIEGNRKVIFENSETAIEQQNLEAAYELDDDRGEQRDVLTADTQWPSELFERHQAELKLLRKQLYLASEARLSPADIEDLAAVGYVDEE